MISSLKVKSGFAKSLPTIERLQRMNLSPGLNILWGPNGCGKTTALKLMAAHALCWRGGWTRLAEPMEAGGLSLQKDDRIVSLGSIADRHTPGHSVAIVEWDLVPVFFANGIDSGRVDIASGEVNDGDGFTNWVEAVNERMRPLSSGQTRAGKLRKMLKVLNDAPDFKAVTVRDHMNDTWRECFQAQIDILAARPDNGRLTVLMDEPEKHLDLKTCKQLWEVVIPTLAENAQLIVASHHPCALVSKGAKWIESEKGNAKESLNIYKELFK